MKGEVFVNGDFTLEFWQEFTALCGSFTKLVLIYFHFFAGQPARATELISIKQSDIYLKDGLIPFSLFCFVLFCFVLFCFVLFCFVLFCFVLFCFVLFCFVLFYLYVFFSLKAFVFSYSLLLFSFCLNFSYSLFANK